MQSPPPRVPWPPSALAQALAPAQQPLNMFTAPHSNRILQVHLPSLLWVPRLQMSAHVMLSVQILISTVLVTDGGEPLRPAAVQSRSKTRLDAIDTVELGQPRRRGEAW